MTSIRLLYFLFLFTVSNFTLAQTTTPAKSSPKFSSVYRTLDLKACRPQGRSLDESSIYLCQGVGFQRIKVNNNGCCFSYISSFPVSYSTKGPEFAFEFRQKTGFERSGRRVEWRVANGIAFAIILQLDELNEADPTKVLHRWLVVKGLEGFEKIAFKVDAKTPNAITKAKKYADKTYSDLLSLKEEQERSINLAHAVESRVEVQERSINLGESFSVDLAPSGNVGLKWGIINPGAPNLELSGFSNTRYTFKAIQRGQVDVVFSLNYRGKNASSRDYGRLAIQVTVK